MAAFLEWATQEVLEAFDHRQLVWTIPRVLRPTFRWDRRLLGELARCTWSTLTAYTQARFPDAGVAPGAILAVQTYGDQLNFHPHLHSLLSDGVWDKQGQSLLLKFFAVTWHLVPLFPSHIVIREVSTFQGNFDYYYSPN